MPVTIRSRGRTERPYPAIAVPGAMTLDRRRTLRLCGLALVGGLAGCTGDGGDGNGGDGDGGSDGDSSPDDDVMDDDPDGMNGDGGTDGGDDGADGGGDGGTDGEATPSGIESEPLPDSGDEELLAAVQTFESQGAGHVSRDEEIDYDTMPPTSGPHYTGTVDAGFHESRKPLGDLVHTLEHGAVVIYYDPAAITPEARASLEAFGDEHTGVWQRVVVVPHPQDDPKAPYVLTAWRHMLRLEEYDPETVRAFLAEYLGRGPENPVR